MLARQPASQPSGPASLPAPEQHHVPVRQVEPVRMGARQMQRLRVRFLDDAGRTPHIDTPRQAVAVQPAALVRHLPAPGCRVALPRHAQRAQRGLRGRRHGFAQGQTLAIAQERQRRPGGFEPGTAGCHDGLRLRGLQLDQPAQVAPDRRGASRVRCGTPRPLVVETPQRSGHDAATDLGRAALDPWRPAETGCPAARRQWAPRSAQRRRPLAHHALHTPVQAVALEGVTAPAQHTARAHQHEQQPPNPAAIRGCAPASCRPRAPGRHTPSGRRSTCTCCDQSWRNCALRATRWARRAIRSSRGRQRGTPARRARPVLATVRRAWRPASAVVAQAALGGLQQQQAPRPGTAGQHAQRVQAVGLADDHQHEGDTAAPAPGPAASGRAARAAPRRPGASSPVRDRRPAVPGATAPGQRSGAELAKRIEEPSAGRGHRYAGT